jgi:ammonia channel protein AmtB
MSEKKEAQEMVGPPNPNYVDLGVENVQPHMGHLYLVVVAAIVSYAVTEVVKPFIFKTCKEKSEAVTRLVSVIIGGIVGYTLSYEILDLWLGASAGALNAYIVKIVKSKIKSTIGVDKTPTAETEKPKENQ